MSKLFSPLSIAGALLALGLAAVPAHAANRTFVSGKGTDSGACALAAPCRTFAFALTQTAAGGEIDVLDPAGYGKVIITQAISIVNDGVGTAGILAGSGNAITINAGANDSVYLRGLTIEGIGTGSNGIVLDSGRSLTITHCTVRNFNGEGIFLVPQGTSSAQVTLDHVSVNENSNGIVVGGHATVLAVDSTAANNRRSGFDVNSPAVLRLAHSAATGNFNGVDVRGGTAESAGNNFIRRNGTDVRGTLTNLGTQ